MLMMTPIESRLVRRGPAGMYPVTATPGGAMSARCVEGAVTAPRAVAFAGQDRWLAGHIPGARLGELRARTTSGWLPEPSRFVDLITFAGEHSR